VPVGEGAGLRGYLVLVPFTVFVKIPLTTK
jgi:hypothetical protein